MDVLILCAGYATRLYPLTLTKAKPLLEVGGAPMIEHVLDHLKDIPNIGRVHIVTNAKFAADFEAWAKQYSSTKKALEFNILNDGSTEPGNALGAIGDIAFTMKSANIQDDLLIVAGDNLFNQSLVGFADEAKRHGEALLGVYDVGDLEAIKKYNSISVDAEGKITFFEEKPQNPASTLTGIALYYYPKHVLPMISDYIAEGNNPDQPGRFVQWLYTRRPVYTWLVPGLWLDIGSKETLDHAQTLF